ncbi:3-hydroxyacyl-CoA dehydrogenase NAD-binding domain-containing protein [Ahrensia marina]|uniref:3-hydroxyacyl-CoA dehydrogenase NAD-binding domain-containing protein n=1 Tax=Ahrensia marina TaxID=1514904 RepID=UPI0035CF6776
MITVLGAGSIGVSFAAAFADAGTSVTLADPDNERRSAADAGLIVQQEAIEMAGLSRAGTGQVSVVDHPGEQLEHSDLVIECGPEKLETKQAIFADLLAQAGKDTILATASSAITISQILPDTSQQRRCLVAHPVNPPAVLRVIELVPAPGTDPTATKSAASLFGAASFEVVQLNHEIEGFVLNRLQGAVLREAYRLINEDVTDVAGIEAIMRMGLGPRWALSGPFETAELNTPGGIKAHAARMGPAYKRIGEARGETVEWSDALVESVDTQRRKAVPAEKLADRAKWRARAVAHLVAARDKLMQY